MKPLNADTLDTMRQTGDPIADEAVAEVFKLGAVDRINELLTSFHHNGDPVQADLPPLLRRYFDETAALPPWADAAAIERGRKLWGRYGPHMGTILHCYSLPICYAWANAAQVLYRTTRIHTKATRRVLETSQFLQDVMAEGGLLSPAGYGLRSAQKIRLLHATVRHFVRKSPDWDQPRLGLAVNQEDLAATMGTFSIAIPEGLVKLGVDLPTRDRDDCFHVWSVASHLIGVDPALMPATFDEGRALMTQIWQRQTAESEAGKVLTAALIKSMRDVVGPALAGAPPSLIRHFCGDRLADLLAVPPADWTALAVQLQSGVSLVYGKVGDHNALVAALSSKAGELLLGAALRAANRGNRYDWPVPGSEAEHRQG